jgi:hypothetical protein
MDDTITTPASAGVLFLSIFIAYIGLVVNNASI